MTIINSLKPLILLCIGIALQFFTAGVYPSVLSAEENALIQALTPTRNTSASEPKNDSNTIMNNKSTDNETVPVSSMLYQVEYKSLLPVTNIVIGEYSTNEVLAKWSAPNNSSFPGSYDLKGPSGEKIVLSIINNGDGGQLLTIYSEYANQFIIKLRYSNGAVEEKFASPPRVVFNCIFNNMNNPENCTPGFIVSNPYRDCARAFAGFVEIVITDSGGTWNKFKQNVITPLQDTTEWNNSDVWTYLFRQMDKGYYAEVRVTTKLCTQAVAQKLQGSPSILSENGRQLNIHYR